MELGDMIKLMESMKKYGITQFELGQEDGCKLKLKREQQEVVSVSSLSPAASPVKMPAAGTLAAVQAAAESEPVEIDSANVVTSPLVGTFYCASSPDAEPFVKVGDRVVKGQILGIIEAMKLMNEVESEYDGVVEAVLIQNEEVVEYGQPLFRIG